MMKKKMKTTAYNLFSVALVVGLLSLTRAATNDIMTPTEKVEVRIRNDGLRAAKLGAPSSMNPYVGHNEEYVELWKAGWESGQ
jgi:hypothetical protein